MYLVSLLTLTIHFSYIINCIFEKYQSLFLKIFQLFFTLLGILFRWTERSSTIKTHYYNAYNRFVKSNASRKAIWKITLWSWNKDHWNRSISILFKGNSPIQPYVLPIYAFICYSVYNVADGIPQDVAVELNGNSIDQAEHI